MLVTSLLARLSGVSAGRCSGGPFGLLLHCCAAADRRARPAVARVSVQKLYKCCKMTSVLYAWRMGTPVHVTV